MSQKVLVINKGRARKATSPMIILCRTTCALRRLRCPGFRRNPAHLFIRLTMRVAVLICAALLGGCGKAPPKAASTLVPLAPTILDEFLAKPQYSNALEVAFRELPTDSWDKGPKPYNLSRMKRVWQIAEPMFEELKPRLR